MKNNNTIDNAIQFENKADLHIHLDGSIRIETLIELAAINQIKLPSYNVKNLKDILGFTDKYTSLEDCLKAFNLTTSILSTSAALYRAAYELVEDAKKENITYLEIRFAPNLHKIRREAAIEAVLAGASLAGEKFKISTGLILCGIRNLPLYETWHTALDAVHYKDKGVIGFDIAGAENGFPASLHKDAIEHVKNAGLGITIHAGEAAGPESIWDAINMGATRIGHGTRILEDPKLVEYAIKNNIILECCLSSNWQTGAIEKLSDHPIKNCFQAGLKVTINTDNTLIHNTTLNNEFHIAQSIGLNNDELRQIINNGFYGAFSDT